MHPDVFKGTQKEYHWWERLRYGFFDEDDPEVSVDIEGGTPFEDYIELITGREIYDLEDELDSRGSSLRIFGDFSPSYLWDPHNWYVLDGNQGCQEPRVVVGQHIHHVFPDAKILLTFRHPTPRLYSRFVSRIPRTPSLRGSSPEDFHDYVVDGIEKYKACFREWSIRHCAYNVSVYRESVVRLVEGMYPVFMADWLRIWPKEQMFIMRYEDYGGHERERVSEVYEFLGLAKLNDQDMDAVAAHVVVNSGSDEYHRYGLMLDKTRKVLDDFYQPFIDKFARLLHDRRFLWKDTIH
ncbi:hypothetical protein V1264_021005 [Littorina saxatilis]|uniref:Sulfotransferase domain-containing protein n=2 Tax=Littorina saxatilis TaxID=31220 RepID=A0AAN9BBC8_9CAEN